MTRASDEPRRSRPRLRLEPHQMPPELADNPIIQYLAQLSPEQEAELDALWDEDITAPPRE